jgi:thioredoxin reductase (NADPH)
MNSAGKDAKHYDVVVAGAGPAGLAAAIYAARYNLKTLVFDMGWGRSTWFQTFSNYVGFPDGITALDLRAAGQRQAEKLGVEFRTEEAIKKVTGREGSFAVSSDKRTVKAEAVILATGIEDVFPQFDGFESYAGRSLYWCVLCDGHYVNGKRVLVVANQNDGVDLALRLRQFTDRLHFLAENLSKISNRQLAKLRNVGIPIFEGSIKSVEAKRKGVFKAVTIAQSDGTKRRLPTDAVFHRLGITPYNDLAKQMKLELDERGLVVVDPATQATNRPGVYAAGDGATGHLHQVHAATYTGSRAAVAAYRRYYDRTFKVR